MNTRIDSFSYRAIRIIITTLLIDFAWIFFRANGLRNALGYVYRMFTKWDVWSLFDGTLYNLGLDRIEFKILIGALIVLAISELIKYTKNIDIFEWFNFQCWWFRWGFYICLICAIFVFGIYGPSFNSTQFIYFQF